MTVKALIDVLNKSEGKSTTVYHFGYNDNGKKEDFMLYRGKLIKVWHYKKRYKRKPRDMAN